MPFRRRRQSWDPAAHAEVERVRGVLAGSALEASPVRAVRVPGTAEIAVFVVIGAGEVRSAWAVARERVDALGRWPVAVAGWEGALDDDVFDRSSYRDGDGGIDTTPAAVIARAGALSLEDAFARLRGDWLVEWSEREWESTVRDAIEATRARVGEAPPERELLALRPDLEALEGRLLDWEEARAPTLDPDAGSHLEWPDAGRPLEPPGMHPVALALLPTPLPEQAMAYVSFWGVEGAGGQEALLAVLRSWRQRFGAELVASWGQTMHLRVTRPPGDLRAAFAVACEQARVVPDGFPGVSIRDHARALLRRDDWLLHDPI